MKKIIVFLVLFLFNISFIKAMSLDYSIDEVLVKENDKLLSSSDEYDINSAYPLSLIIKINNNFKNDYKINILKEEELIDTIEGSVNKEIIYELNKPSSDSEVYTINLVNINDELLDSKELKFNYPYLEKLKNTIIYISSIKQADEEIKLEDIISLNDSEDLNITFKGKNLVEGSNYNVDGTFSFTANSEELTEGITKKYYTNISLKDLLLKYNVNGEFEKEYEINKIPIMIDDEIKMSSIEFSNKVDRSYDYNLYYTNYKDEKIYSLNDMLILNNNYIDKTLSININQSGFDKENDYLVNIDILKGQENVYNYQETVRFVGSSIDIKLDNLSLDLIKNINDEEYELYLTVSGITNKSSFIINSLGKNASVKTYVSYGKDKYNLSSKNEEDIENAFLYKEFNYKLNEENNLFIRFNGINFDKQDYNYVFSFEEEEIDSGLINGEKFNKNGITFELKSAKEGKYSFKIYNSLELLFEKVVNIEYSSLPRLTTLEILNSDKPLFINYKNEFISLSSEDLYLKISFENLDINKEYTLNICSLKCDKHALTKEEIEKGTAAIKLDSEYNYYTVSIDSENINSEFKILYLKDKDIIKESKYTLFNNLLKGIKSRTSYENFYNNISLNNGFKIKNNEEDFVKTGDVITLMDEYNKELAIINAVVEGDVNGDGEISLTDLVKIKKDIDSIEKLTGIYKEAGLLTNDKDINKEDLLKLGNILIGEEVGNK